MTRHFWGKVDKKPSWWPTLIPFQNVSKRTFTRSRLVQIIRAYKQFKTGAITQEIDQEPDKSTLDSNTSGVEDSIFSSTEDLSSPADDYFQDKDDSTQPENMSENEFLPGFCSGTDISDEVILKQPECTSRNIDDILPTCSISNLTDALTIHPLNV